MSGFNSEREDELRTLRREASRTPLAASGVVKLTPHDQFLLDQWGRQLKEAFGWRAYQVGSSVFPKKGEPAPRDIDVRLMLPDDEFDALIGEGTVRLRALNLAVTLWGRHVTGLHIDFQFQTIDSANEEFGGGPRSALGLLCGSDSTKDGER